MDSIATALKRLPDLITDIRTTSLPGYVQVLNPEPEGEVTETKADLPREEKEESEEKDGNEAAESKRGLPKVRVVKQQHSLRM